MIRRTLIGLAATLVMAAGSSTALAQGTAFTYQGQLRNAGAAVNSATDMQFSLFTAASGGTQVGSTVTVNAVPVSQGLFTAAVDFGVNPYAASNQTYFLQIAVRNPAGSGSFVPMGARQAITPAPFSLATRGINVGSTGNVGIGTATPAAPLDVLGNLRVLSNGTIRNQAVANVFGNHNGLIETFYADNDRFGIAQLPAGKLAIYSGDVFGGSAVQIGTMTGASTFSPSMTVARTGTVGIGTDSPSRLLGVAGGIQVDRFENNNGTLQPNGFLNTNMLTFGFDNGGEGIGSSRTAGSINRFGLDFFTGYARRLSITLEGNVGIGTDTPTARLHNVGTTRLDDALQFGTQTFNGTTGTSINLRRQILGANESDVQLNLDSPNTGGTYSALVIRNNTSNRFEFRNDGTAFKPGGGSWSVLSDERTKSDVQLLSGTLDRLLKLKGHSYTYKPEYVESGKALPGTQIGLVAQEVEAVFPDWVTIGRDGMKTVTERSTTALMVEAMRDLRNEKDAEINELKARLEKLEAMLAAQAAK